MSIKDLQTCSLEFYISFKMVLMFIYRHYSSEADKITCNVSDSALHREINCTDDRAVEIYLNVFPYTNCTEQSASSEANSCSGSHQIYDLLRNPNF
jgi:hypothetical protein